MNRSTLLGGGSIFPAEPPKPVVVPNLSTVPQPPAVALCIPSFSTWMADMAMAFSALCGHTVNVKAARLAMCNQKASMITMARNDLAQRAVEMNADFALFIDSDLTFPPDALVRLLAHGKDVVAGTYNKRVPPYETLGKLKGEVPPVEELLKGGLREADYLPGGFMLIRTEVFKKLAWPWFYETHNRHGSPVDSFVGMVKDSFMLQPTQGVVDMLTMSKELNTWLSETWPLEPGNRVMSEDYNFCRKARFAGYQLWCDLDLTWQIRHIGEHSVSCEPPRPPTKDGAQPSDRAPSIVTV
jgi:hypothetical protein